MHGFAFDNVHDEIVVTSPLTQSVLIFRGGANGEEPPVRVIQGRKTQILGSGYGGLDKVSVDPVNNEILVPISAGEYQNSAVGGVLVFDRMANGDVAPKRVLQGPDTQIQGYSSVGVDPINNLLFVNNARAMLIFDRTASGNVKPRAVISGPKSGIERIDTIQILPAKSLLVARCSGGSICVWNVTDNGDIPPRWKLPVQQLTGYSPSGIALNPVHKEIMLSAAGQRDPPPNGIMNTVITFSWPELFD